MNKRRGKGVTGIFAENIGRVVFVLLLLSATSFLVSASAQPCDHEVEVLGVCCGDKTTAGWFYNESTGWVYSSTDHTALFRLSVDGDEYYAYCTEYEVYLMPGNTFNASIYRAEPTCKNNSIAYILNNWAYGCAHCDNVSAGQSAIWYFWYINESFCSLGTPKYNHTVKPGEPGWESNWIPDCNTHPEACDFINGSIKKRVPYKISTEPGSGNFPSGEPIPLETTVYYCAGEKEEVTIVYETDNPDCEFENEASEYENVTINGIARATLTCAPDVKSANVTARVKDMKWFEIVDPCDEYQGTFRIINITDETAFSFYVPGEVDGYIYEDRNCNCAYDGGDEPGVPDVTVWLYNDSSSLVNMTTLTNASGYYLFTNVTPGDYWVRYNVSDLPAHLNPKCDDDGGSANESYPFNVPEGGRHTHNFGVNSSANISIVKLVNGEKEINTSLGETVTFTLNVTNTGKVNVTNLTVIDVMPIGLTWADDANIIQDSITVNPDNTTTIIWKNNLTSELPPGDFFVISFNATVHPILAISGSVLNNSANVTGESDWGVVYDADKASVRVKKIDLRAIVSGNIYEDRNCNCTFDEPSEPRVENVTVELVNATSGLQVNTTRTTAWGYVFNNVTPGSYWVRYNVSELPAHLSPKCDDDGGSANESYPFTVSEGDWHTHDFGVKSKANVGIEKLVDGVKTKRVLRIQTVTYTLNITNTGDVNLMNITVVDLLPASITWADAANPGQDSVTPNPNGTTTIVWKNNLTVYPFEPGESFDITFNATVNESAVCDKLYENWATVNATSDWGSVGPRSDHADVFLTTTEKVMVPVLTPLGIAALIGLLSLFAVLGIKRKRE